MKFHESNIEIFSKFVNIIFWKVLEKLLKRKK